MVLASHVIFGAYGFWLPNDPRGSWSDFVGSWEIFRAGGGVRPAQSRHSVAHAPHDHRLRQSVKQALRQPPVSFSTRQREFIGQGFDRFAKKNGLTILACAIMPEHVHLVIARHRYEVEKAVILLKGEATRVLDTASERPDQWNSNRPTSKPKWWARGEWKVFLFDRESVGRAVAYVEANPLKDGLPPQNWDFVQDWKALI